MNSGKYVFAQLLQFVNKYEFEKCAKCYKGNHRVRELKDFLTNPLALFLGSIILG